LAEGVIVLPPGVLEAVVLVALFLGSTLVIDIVRKAIQSRIAG
jgi:hypothetical protein